MTSQVMRLVLIAGHDMREIFNFFMVAATANVDRQKDDETISPWHYKVPW